MFSRLLVLAAGLAMSASAFAQSTTTFTYQGELLSEGLPATGSYDLRFRLFDSPAGSTQIGSTLCVDNITVDNGKFTVALDFGALFTQPGRFLEVAVRADSPDACAISTGFTALAPLQPITSAPSASFASAAASADTATTATTAGNATQLNGQPASFYTSATNLAAGTLADARLSTNVPRVNALNTFQFANVFENRVRVGSPGLAGAMLEVTGGDSATGVLRVSGADEAGVSITAGRGAEAMLKGGDEVGAIPAQRVLLQGGSGSNQGGNVELRSGGSTSGNFGARGGDILLLPGQGPLLTQRGRVGVNTLTPTAAFTILGGGPIEPVLQVLGDTGASIDLIAGDANGQPQVGGVFIKGGKGNSSGGPDRGGNVTLEGGAGQASTTTAFSGPGGNIILRSGPAGDNIANPTQRNAPGGVGINVENPFATLDVSGPPTSFVGLRQPFSFHLRDQQPLVQISSFTDLPSTINFATATRTAGLRFRPADLSLSLGWDARSDLVVPDTGDISIGSTGNARNLRVTGSLTSVGSVTAPTFVGALTGNAAAATNAAQLNGQPAAFYQSAANLTTGTLPDARLGSNIARTNVGNVFTGTIEAPLFVGPLTGNATSATNAVNLNGQPASFYQSAGNLTSGTLPDARLSANVARLDSNITFVNLASFNSGVDFNGVTTFNGFTNFSNATTFDNAVTMQGVGGLNIEEELGGSGQLRLQISNGQPTLRVAGLGPASLAGLRFGTPGAINAMRIANDGNIGVGLVPRVQFDVRDSEVVGVAPSPSTSLSLERNGINYLSILSPDANSKGLLFGSPASNAHGSILYSNASGMTFGTTNNLVRLQINSLGNAGLGTEGNSIDARLHVQADGARPMKVDRFTNDGELLVWARDDINIGAVSVAAGVVTYGAFTGVHYATLEAPTHTYMLVSMTGNNTLLGAKSADDASASGETVYGVVPSVKPNDPAVLGVYLASLDAQDFNHATPLAQIAAVGNADVLIVDNGTGDSIKPGDYLISSGVAGAAMKLDPSQFPVGHVIAKAAGNVDWSTVPADATGIKRAKVSVLFTSFTHTDPSLADRVRVLEQLLGQK